MRAQWSNNHGKQLMSIPAALLLLCCHDDTCADRADEHREPDRVYDQAAGGDDDQTHQFLEQDHLQAASAGSSFLLLVFDGIYIYISLVSACGDRWHVGIHG